MGCFVFLFVDGGCRTSWEKTWFQSPHIWQTKVDFYNDTSVSNTAK